MQDHWRKLYATLPGAIERIAFKRYFNKEHHALQQNNPLGVASNFTKQEVLKKFQRQYQLNTLVETGTYLGDTLFSLYHYFSTLYSIELSEYYYARAQKRFKNYPKIKLINGDSGTQLHNLVPQLNQPALFWLDGHYSGGLTAKGDKECPIYGELDAILKSSLPHVIVIDDARLFVGKNDYPTMEDLTAYVKNRKPNHSIAIETDSIRILPS